MKSSRSDTPSRLTPEEVAKLTPLEVQTLLLETRALIAKGDEGIEALVDDFALLCGAFNVHTQAAAREINRRINLEDQAAGRDNAAQRGT